MFGNNYSYQQPNYSYQQNYQQNYQPRPITNIEYVTGVESVRAMPLPPNCTKFVLDSEKNIFYIKKTDADGRPTIKVYQFTDTEEQQKVVFATIEQLEQLKQELDGIKQILGDKNG